MNELSPHRRAAVLLGAALLLLGFLAYTGFALGNWTGPVAEDGIGIWVYEGVMIGAAASCLLRAALIPRERLGWGLVGLALASYVAGEIYFVAASEATGEVPIPSPADAGYLAFYPTAFAGLIALVRVQLGSFPPVRWLDGLIAGGAVAALAVALALGPVVADSVSGSTAEVTVNLAYPVVDVVLLFLVVAAATLSGWRPGAGWLLLGGGLTVIAAADVAYLLQTARGTYVEDGILDVAWPLAVLMLAAAAWLPPATAGRSRSGRLASALVPALAALVAVGILFSDRWIAVPLAASILALLTLLGVVLRLALSFGETQRSLETSLRDALTDPLTGLRNRRGFVEDLEQAMEARARGRVGLLAMFDLNGFKAYNDAFGHPAGDALLTRLGKRLEEFARPHGRAYRLGGDEFCLLGECTAAEVERITEEATAALSDEGKGFTVTAARGSVLIPAEADTASVAMQLADRRMYAHKSRERASAGRQSRDVLMSALRERRPELHRHLVGVAELARRVGCEMGLTGEQLDEVYRAAELHDVGKVAIPDAILNKPGPLEERELEFMRKHTLIGERIIAAAPALVPVARLVRSSHERPDGKGYPDGLSGEEIPVGSRIISVCDAYQAMVTERPYSTAMRPHRAMAELVDGAGAQFDPVVVAAFRRVIDEAGEAGLAAGRGAEPADRRTDDL
ncbi:MAG: diguanylate cyclase [Solirubrobacterales bacterium]